MSLVERYQRELRGRCYRMLGPIEDAEERKIWFRRPSCAWKNFDRFEGRATFRVVR